MGAFVESSAPGSRSKGVKVSYRRGMRGPADLLHFKNDGCMLFVLTQLRAFPLHEFPPRMEQGMATTAIGWSDVLPRKVVTPAQQHQARIIS